MMQLHTLLTSVELENYKVKYYVEELSPEKMILKKLFENSDTSPSNSKFLTAFNALFNLYKNLTGIQEPKALLTCADCLVDLD